MPKIKAMPYKKILAKHNFITAPDNQNIGQIL